MTFINKKTNLIFALYLTILPLLVTFFSIFSTTHISFQLFIWGISYTIFLGISFILTTTRNVSHIKKIKLSPISIIALSMLFILILTSIINNSINTHFFLYIIIYLIFICIYNIDKKYIYIIINTLLTVFGLCCILGFIDPIGAIIPGFSTEFRPLALQYNHPNYSATIMATMTISAFLLENKFKNKIKFKIFYISLHTIFATFLFFNGSYVAICSIILIEIISIICIWIYAKKVPLTNIILLTSLIPICFLIDLVPNIKIIRTCEYNYFLETIAVFDNIFGTNLLDIFNIESIPGADGWNRNELMLNALKFSVSSVETFLFGSGAGEVFTHRPHNILLSLLVEFGIFMPLLYLTLIILIIIKVFRKKFEINIIYFGLISITFLLANMTGSLIHYTYYISIIYLSILFKILKDTEDKIKINELPENKNKKNKEPIA